MNRRSLFTILAIFLLAIAAGAVLALGGPGPDRASSAATGEAKGDVKGDIGAAAEAWQWINEGALVIDVRTAKEFNGGHIEGALNIPYTETNALAEAIGSDKTRPVVLYCRSGRRSGVALKKLEGLGYSKLFNGTGYTALAATRP